MATLRILLGTRTVLVLLLVASLCVLSFAAEESRPPRVAWTFDAQAAQAPAFAYRHTTANDFFIAGDVPCFH